MTGPSLVVFAAGKGTRLRPLTDQIPKALIPILDVPLIDLALARGEGVDWACRFVNVSHFGSMLSQHLAEQPGITVLDEGEEPLGTGATLRRLLPELSATVVTYNCDLVSDLLLSDLLAAHRAGGKPCTLAVRAVARAADLVIGGGGLRLIDRRVDDLSGFMFLGAACFDRDLLMTIPDTVPLGLAAGLLERAIEEQQVELFEHPGYAADCGTPERYLQISLDALDGSLPTRPPGTIDSGGWYLGPGATADESSLGTGSVVLAGARVGAGARLSQCVVWPGSHVPEDTVLECGIWFRGEVLAR